MMKTILELKAQNDIITSNQKRIFNKLAMDDDVISFDTTLKKNILCNSKNFHYKTMMILTLLKTFWTMNHFIKTC